jgi:hypothetical protein
MIALDMHAWHMREHELWVGIAVCKPVRGVYVEALVSCSRLLPCFSPTDRQLIAVAKMWVSVYRVHAHRSSSGSWG